MDYLLLIRKSFKEILRSLFLSIDSKILENNNNSVWLGRQSLDKKYLIIAFAVYRRVLKIHGLDWDKMCPSNNDHCPV